MAQEAHGHGGMWQCGDKLRRNVELSLGGCQLYANETTELRHKHRWSPLLQFIQLCWMQKFGVVDLNGSDLAVKSADGTLLTTITAALAQHRSAL